MSSLNKNTFLRSLMFYFPSLVLFLSVLNEIDLNYLEIEYFSFNFVYILIFYWTLKNPHYLSYGSIFIAGLVNFFWCGWSVETLFELLAELKYCHGI